MKQERMMILTMLENGKINAEEAERLLNALKRNGNAFDKDDFSDNLEDRFTKIVEGFNSFAKDLGEKLDNVAKDVEPKLKKATKIVVDKTTSAIDEISKTLGDKHKADDEEGGCGCGCDDQKEDEDDRSN